MRVHFDIPWGRLERWSSIGFVISGVGTLLALVLLLLDPMFGMTPSEMVISAAVVPNLLALTVFALPGFYPYIADASPRLALIGGIAGFVAGATMVFQVAVTGALHVLGISGFTEEGPLIGLFFVLMLAIFLSLLFYGLASVLSGEPSRLVGILLLGIVVDPASTLLNDVLGLNLGIEVLYVTLVIAGGALCLVGYLLWGATGPDGSTESASQAPA